MKTIKQKKLTGRPEIDKYLTACTGLREMVYIPKEMSPSRFDGYTEFISFLTHYVEPELPAEQLYEILYANYEESEYLDISTVAHRLIDAGIKLIIISIQMISIKYAQLLDKAMVLINLSTTNIQKSEPVLQTEDMV